MKKILLASVASAALAFAPAAAMAATPWPLGVFPPVTAYSGGYSSEVGFANLMGVPYAAIENDYVDYTQDPGTNGANWLGSSDYGMGGFDNYSENGGPNNNTNPWLPGSGVIPLINVPMVSSASGAPSYETILQNYSNGTYDSMLQGMVSHWYNAGYHTQYWRPGVEMNEYSYTPSLSCTTDSVCLGYWRAAFQHIYTVMHAEASSIGATVKIVWNPGADAGGLIDPSGSNAYWPGAAYVDIIGLDLYGNAYPDNSNNPCTNYTNVSANLTCDPASGGTTLGFLEAINFAIAQGKPLAFPETGAGGNGDGTSASSGEDNPLFPQWLASILANSSVTVAFVSLWDSNGGCECGFTPASSSGKPNEAAAWAQYFGNGASGGSSGSGTGGTGGTGAASTPSASGTQVNGPIGTIKDTTSDTFSLSLGNQIIENGGAIASSANVVSLYYLSGTLYQYTTGSGWYTQPTSGAAGAATSQPAGWVAPPAASAANTQVNGTTGSFYDNYGNRWAINSSGQETVNGTVIASSAGVVTIFFTGTGIDQLNTSGNWYTQPEDGSAGAATTAPSGYSSGATALTVSPISLSLSNYSYGTPSIFQGLTISDTNPSQTESAVVSISSTSNGAIGDPASSTDGSTLSAGNLTIPATTASALQVIINGLQFHPVMNEGANGATFVTTFTVKVTDSPAGVNASSTTTLTVTQAPATFSGNKCG